jgi:hypothetical protein
MLACSKDNAMETEWSTPFLNIRIFSRNTINTKTYLVHTVPIQAVQLSFGFLKFIQFLWNSQKTTTWCIYMHFQDTKQWATVKYGQTFIHIRNPCTVRLAVKQRAFMFLQLRHSQCSLCKLFNVYFTLSANLEHSSCCRR